MQLVGSYGDACNQLSEKKDREERKEKEDEEEEEEERRRRRRRRLTKSKVAIFFFSVAIYRSYCTGRSRNESFYVREAAC